MRGESYLSVGNVSMGIAGSIVNHDFFESWLGMRVQTVDMTEVRRRLDNGIYDKAELDRALAWPTSTSATASIATSNDVRPTTSGASCARA